MMTFLKPAWFSQFRLTADAGYLGGGGIWQSLGGVRLSVQPQQAALQQLAAGLGQDQQLLAFCAPDADICLGDGLAAGVAASPTWQVREVRKYAQHQEIILQNLA